MEVVNPIAGNYKEAFDAFPHCSFYDIDGLTNGEKREAITHADGK